MPDVKTDQIWKVRLGQRGPWRRVRVINVSLDAVELQYLDLPDAAPDLPRTFQTSRSRMLAKNGPYKFVANY
jgi:hypothetical protein